MSVTDCESKHNDILKNPDKIKNLILSQFYHEIVKLNVIKIYFTKSEIYINENYSHYCYVVIRNNLDSQYQYAKKLFGNELTAYLVNNTQIVYSVQVYEEDRFERMVNKRQINVSTECVDLDIFGSKGQYTHTKGQQAYNEMERIEKELTTDALAELSELSIDIQKTLLEEAIKAKKYNLVNYIISKQKVISNDFFVELLKNKADISIIRQTYNKMNEVPNCLDIIAEHGDLDIFKFFFLDKKQDTSKRTMNIAAKHGHLEIVKFLFCVGEGALEDAIVIAKYYKQEHVVKWVASKGYSL